MKIFDVFISYRQPDGAELAGSIAKNLRKTGLRVFCAEEEIRNGADPAPRIESTLRQARSFLLAVTPDLLRFRDDETDRVLKEIGTAAEIRARDPDADRTCTVVLPACVSHDADPTGTGRGRSTLFRPEAWLREIYGLSGYGLISLRKDLPGPRECREILSSVTRITRRAMWNAGRRWLEDVPKPDSHGTETACPRADLIRIMEDAYRNREYSGTARIPLIIDLSKAPDEPGRMYAFGKSTFIRREIFRQVRAARTMSLVGKTEAGELEEIFRFDPSAAVEPVDALFAEDRGTPEYLLLLDGQDKVSRTEMRICHREEDRDPLSDDPDRVTPAGMIREEIDLLSDRRRFPNVSVLMAGPADIDLLNEKPY